MLQPWSAQVLILVRQREEAGHSAFSKQLVVVCPHTTCTLATQASNLDNILEAIANILCYLLYQSMCTENPDAEIFTAVAKVIVIGVREKLFSSAGRNPRVRHASTVDQKRA